MDIPTTKLARNLSISVLDEMEILEDSLMHAIDNHEGRTTVDMEDIGIISNAQQVIAAYIQILEDQLAEIEAARVRCPEAFRR